MFVSRLVYFWVLVESGSKFPLLGQRTEVFEALGLEGEGEENLALCQPFWACFGKKRRQVTSCDEQGPRSGDSGRSKMALFCTEIFPGPLQCRQAGNHYCPASWRPMRERPGPHPGGQQELGGAEWPPEQSEGWGITWGHSWMLCSEQDGV